MTKSETITPEQVHEESQALVEKIIQLTNDEDIRVIGTAIATMAAKFACVCETKIGGDREEHFKRLFQTAGYILDGLVPTVIDGTLN